MTIAGGPPLVDQALSVEWWAAGGLLSTLLDNCGEDGARFAKGHRR